jgi:hypothetical protein
MQFSVCDAIGEGDIGGDHPGGSRAWIAGTLYDLTGSYSLAFWFSITCTASQLSQSGVQHLTNVAVFASRAEIKLNSDS